MVKKKHIYHLLATPEEAGKYVFLTGDPDRVPSIAKFFQDSREVSSLRGLKVHTGLLDNVRVAAVSTGIGCPSTAIVVEELIMLGVHTFLRIGTCGSLQQDIEAKDVVISCASIRDEGTTKQYVPIEFPAVAHFELVANLITASQEANARFHVGITHCKDAFFSELPEHSSNPIETENRWAAWVNAKALATEMEASALFILSSLRGCRSAAVLSVVGSVMKKDLVTDVSGVERVIKIGIDAMRKQIRKDRSSTLQVKTESRD